MEFAVFDKRLVVVDHVKLDAVLVHPVHGVQRVVDKGVGQDCIGFALGDALEVFAVLLGRVLWQNNLLRLLVCHVRHERPQIIQRLKRNPNCAICELAVAAPLMLRPFL